MPAPGTGSIRFESRRGAVESEVARVLASILKVAPEDVQQTSRLREDLGIDSLDAIEALVMLEDRYGVSMGDDEIAGIVTVADLADAIAGRIGAPG